MLRLSNDYTLTPDGKIEKRKRNKFGARKTQIDGFTFDSLAEANHYRELRLREQAGEITDLKLQPEYLLHPAFKDRDGKNHRAIYYRTDFSYNEQGRRIVEDFKGFETEVFRIKRKLFLFKYPELVLRVTKKGGKR